MNLKYILLVFTDLKTMYGQQNKRQLLQKTNIAIRSSLYGTEGRNSTRNLRNEKKTSL